MIAIKNLFISFNLFLLCSAKIDQNLANVQTPHLERGLIVLGSGKSGRFVVNEPQLRPPQNTFHRPKRALHPRQMATDGRQVLFFTLYILTLQQEATTPLGIGFASNGAIKEPKKTLRM